MRKWILIAATLLLSLPVFAQRMEDGWPVAIERKPFTGYRFFVEGAYGIGMDIQTHPFGIRFNTDRRYFNAGTTQGYQLGSLFFLGLGASYMQLVGESVDKELPHHQITAYGDFRFTFGRMFAAYLDLRPGVAFLWEGKSWEFATTGGLGFDIARSFQLGLEVNLLPLRIGKENATPMDTLIGIHAGLSFGHGCRR